LDKGRKNWWVKGGLELFLECLGKNQVPNTLNEGGGGGGKNEESSRAINETADMKNCIGFAKKLKERKGGRKMTNAKHKGGVETRPMTEGTRGRQRSYPAGRKRKFCRARERRSFELEGKT